MSQSTRPQLYTLIALMMLLPSVAWSGDWHFDDVDRVVAMADIHGAYDAMTETLKKASVLDTELKWSGGKTHLVIVGDILDRGPESRATMELLMRLEDEAEAAGGRVHVLIGNHESMLMTGDLRYVSAAEYAAFAADENPAERAQWFQLYAARKGGSEKKLREQFDKKFPPGYFAMRRMFRADGRYGQWLLEKNIIVVINGTAFVHGGLSPAVTKLGLSGINGMLKSDLAEYVRILGLLTDAEILLPTDSHYAYKDILESYRPRLRGNTETLDLVRAAMRLEKSALLSTDGPLWYRGNVLCPEIIEDYRLKDALAAIDAKRVVVGHTPTPNHNVLQRFDGRLIEIDTGMLNFYYKGSGNALELKGDAVTVINQSASETSVPMNHPRRVGRRPANLTAEQLEDLLETGEIASVNSKDGDTVVVVQKGAERIEAFFKKRAGRDVYPDLAAYRLDKLLELDMVPVTVKREVNGRDGTLQFLPEKTFDEVERSASGAGGGAHCPIPEQWAAMYLFDILIYNEGRSQHRMDYDRSSLQLMLSEHDLAFAAKKGRPRHLAKVSLVVTRDWKDALTKLSDEVLEEALSDVLDKRRLRALAARRDELLATE